MESENRHRREPSKLIVAVNDSDKHAAQTRIHRLPVEILCKIFRYLPNFLPRVEDHNASFARRVDLGLIRDISHVCRRWRAISISDKELWSLIPLQHRAWTETALARSDPVPVVVDIRPYSLNEKPDGHAIHLVMGQLHRVREVIIRERYMQDVINFDNSAICSAPSLQRLELEGSIFGRSHPPPALLEAMPPNLRHLSLTCYTISTDHLASAPAMKYLRSIRLIKCTVSLAHPLFNASITALEIAKCRVWKTQGDFIQLLSRMPSLQFLKLIRDRYPGEITPSGSRPLSVVSLPHLRNLILRDTSSNVLTISRSLVLPPSTHLDFDVASTMGSADGDVLASALAKFYAPMTPSDKQQAFDTAEIEVAHTRVEFNFRASCESALEDTLGGLHLSWYEMFLPETSRVLSMATNLPVMANVRTLRITYGEPVQFLHRQRPAAWLNSFKAMKQIERIHVIGRTGHHLAVALADEEPGWFPALRTITLESASLHVAAKYLVKDLHTSAFVRTAEDLTSRSLEIRRCRISTKEVEFLRRSLMDKVEVEWDGIEMMPDEWDYS